MKNQILLFLDCLSTFKTTPFADIKTNSDVESAEINGSGKPVSEIEPVNISYCTIFHKLNVMQYQSFENCGLLLLILFRPILERQVNLHLRKNSINQNLKPALQEAFYKNQKLYYYA